MKRLSCGRKKRKAIIDDGMNPELVTGARFDGDFEIPFIEDDKTIAIPQRLVPFSQLSQMKEGDALCFYEPDVKFADILIDPGKYARILKDKTIVSPDCSLYRNAPLAVQIANIYKSRAIGCFLQRQGVRVIPNARWGGRWTYTTEFLRERIAFLGIEKGSLISVGTYGCIRSGRDKEEFSAGLGQAIRAIQPRAVLVYGAMPKDVFTPYMSQTKFVHYPNWISYCKGGKD